MMMIEELNVSATMAMVKVLLMYLNKLPRLQLLHAQEVNASDMTGNFDGLW